VTEGGVHDPEGMLGRAPEPASFLRINSEDEVAQLNVFESRKKSVGLGTAPAWGGVLLLANTLLGGSGMLGIPHAFSVAGYMLGMVLITFFACCSAFGSHLLACSAKRVGRVPSSFYSVTNVVVPRWTWLVDGAVAIKCCGVTISYLIIVGDLFPEAMEYFGAYSKRWLYVTITWSIGAVLASFQSISALRWTAGVAVLIVLWSAALIILFYFRTGASHDPCPEYPGLLPCNGAEFARFGSEPLKIAKSLPVFIFGFTCQQNVFSICNEVVYVSKKRVNNIIFSAYFLSLAAFTVTAVFGYITYGDRVAPDVLKTYPANALVGITRIMFSILVTFSYPLQVHPARNSCLALWRFASPSGDAVAQARWGEEQRRVEGRRYIMVTGFLLLLSLCVALLLEDLGVILGIVGATGSTTVSYILPGLVYFSTFRSWSIKRVFALMLLCAGLVIMPTCLVLLFM